MDMDPVTVYDDRLITINTFNYLSNSNADGTSLNLQTYSGNWGAGLDAGFGL